MQFAIIRKKIWSDNHIWQINDDRVNRGNFEIVVHFVHTTTKYDVRTNFMFFEGNSKESRNVRCHYCIDE